MGRFDEISVQFDAILAAIMGRQTAVPGQEQVSLEKVAGTSLTTQLTPFSQFVLTMNSTESILN